MYAGKAIANAPQATRTPSSAGYTSRNDSMTANARIGKTMRWAGGETNSRRAIRVVSAWLSATVFARRTCISGRLHRFDDPAERVALARHFDDGPRHDDVRARRGDSFCGLGSSDAAPHDDRDVDRFPHGLDHLRRDGLRRSAAGLEVDELHPEHLGREGVLDRDRGALAADQLGVPDLPRAHPRFDDEVRHRDRLEPPRLDDRRGEALLPDNQARVAAVEEAHEVQRVRVRRQVRGARREQNHGNPDRLLDRQDGPVDLVLRHPGRPADHDRVRAGAAGLRREGRGLRRRLLVRIEEGHVQAGRTATLEDRLVHVHRNAPARNAARATIIAYFVTRWERAGFAAEWKAA